MSRNHVSPACPPGGLILSQQYGDVMKKLVCLPVAAILICAGVLVSQSFAAKEGGIFMKLQSTAFKDGEMMPGK
jgi:hypothetical protein